VDNADWLPVVAGALAALVLLTVFAMCLELMGALPVSQQERADRREDRRLQANVAALAARHQPGQTPQTLHYAPHVTYPALPSPAPLALPEAAPALPEAALPGPCTLSDVLRGGFTPTADAILLGKGLGDSLITVSADDALCHILTAGRSGRGKSALFRLLMVQLLLAGLRVSWFDPNFAQFDKKRKIDLRPLASAVGGGLVTSIDQIARAFTHLATVELPRRQAEKRRTGDPGPAFYVFADEWPQLVGSVPGLDKPAALCLRNFRQYDGYFVVGSQDGLVETTGLNSGELGQFGTLYYVGGADDTTRKRLTGSTRNLDPPGKGIVWLSASVLQTPQLVRVPYVSNRDMYDLLGAPDSPPPWGWEGLQRSWRGASIVDVTPEAVEAREVTARPAPAQAPDPPPPATSAPSGPFPGEVDPRIAQVRELLRQRKGNSEIIAEVWGVTGGRAFKSAAQELTEMIAQLVEGA
jgi:hypothetical protein